MVPPLGLMFQKRWGTWEKRGNILIKKKGRDGHGFTVKSYFKKGKKSFIQTLKQVKNVKLKKRTNVPRGAFLEGKKRVVYFQT